MKKLTIYDTDEIEITVLSKSSPNNTIITNGEDLISANALFYITKKEMEEDAGIDLPRPPATKPHSFDELEKKVFIGGVVSYESWDEFNNRKKPNDG